MKLNNATVIERDVKCPFCGNSNAMLISKEEGSKTAVGLPSYGLRFLLRCLYLGIIQIVISGFKLFQVSRKKDISTYIFCPACGNSVSANAPECVKQELEEPKLYRIKKDKVVSGLSKGIAEYTGISVLWIRIVNILFVASGLYFSIAACIPFKEDVLSGIADNRKFAKAKKGKGKWIFGLCKGISNYIDVPVVWIRILACISAIFVIPGIAYIVFGIVIKKVEE